MTLPEGVTFVNSAYYDHRGSGQDYLVDFQSEYKIGHARVNIFISQIDIRNPKSAEAILVAKLGEPLHSAGTDDQYPLSREALDRLDLVSNEIQEWAETQCASKFRNLVEELKPKEDISADKPSISLHWKLHAPGIGLHLKTVHGILTIERRDTNPPRPDYMHRGFSVNLTKDERYPTYLASDVIVRKMYEMPEVLVNGEICRCRLNTHAKSTEREHEIYLQIQKAGLQHLRIPAFKGYVDDISGTGCIGLLFQEIETKHASLRHAVGSSPLVRHKNRPPRASLERRTKWGRQIQEIVDELHKHGIVWTSVDLETMIVDVNDDVWIHDFEGGVLQQWVLLADANTMEGDQKAMLKLQEYLRTGKEPSAPPPKRR